MTQTGRKADFGLERGLEGKKQRPLGEGGSLAEGPGFRSCVCGNFCFEKRVRMSDKRLNEWHVPIWLNQVGINMSELVTTMKPYLLVVF